MSEVVFGVNVCTTSLVVLVAEVTVAVIVTVPPEVATKTPSLRNIGFSYFMLKRTKHVLDAVAAGNEYVRVVNGT